LPDNYHISITLNGYTSDLMAYDWIYFFHAYTKNCISSGEYYLLLMDGHDSHKIYEFIQFCKKHYIIPYPFPPHLTHLLQPLDGKPFLQYKHYYRKNNNQVVLLAGSIKEKKDFLRDIDGIRRKTFTARTIRASFADRGIYPVKSHIVIQPLMEALPEDPILEEYTGDTPPPSSSTTNSPPTTVKKLRHSINKARVALDELNNELSLVSPKLTKRLDHIFKGSLIQAELNARHKDDIEQILRNREHLNTKKSRRQIRIRGPLCVRDANRHVNAREAEEIEKEWRRQRRTNILGVTAPTAREQTNDHPGNSSADISLVDTIDEPVSFFWIDSTGTR